MLNNVQVIGLIQVSFVESGVSYSYSIIDLKKNIRGIIFWQNGNTAMTMKIENASWTKFALSIDKSLDEEKKM